MMTWELLIDEVAKIVSTKTGIQLGIKQFAMMKSRLFSRFTELKITTPDDYKKYLDKNLATETQVLVSLMTTHYTSFFREFNQFEYLEKEILAKTFKDKQEVKIWTAACSRGHEPYSVAMFMENSGRNYSLLATDVDEKIVKFAENGVYLWQELAAVPKAYLGNYWMRGTGNISEYVKIKDHVKKKIRFKMSNLFNTSTEVQEKFDVIFCRNVFIYFSEAQVEKIVTQLVDKLNPGGYLFIGISESLHGKNTNIKGVHPSVYRKPDPKEVKTSEDISVSLKPSVVSGPLIKVFCIDDSNTVHVLMRKILTKENGFEIVGKAVNGQEAIDNLKFCKPDIITLDLHMPVLDGIGFLENSKTTIPVVVVSSISRENQSVAQKALELGAIDYVEKPSLQDLETRGEEIRNKLKVAIKPIKHSLGQDFEKLKSETSALPSEYQCILWGSSSDASKMLKVSELLNQEKIPNSLHVGKELLNINDNMPTVYLVFTNMIENIESLYSLKGVAICEEGVVAPNHHEKIIDIIPYTSMAYHVKRYFSTYGSYKKAA